MAFVSRFLFFFAAKTTAINFREVVSHHENAETMKDFLNLKKKWKERGKDNFNPLQSLN